MSPRISDRSSVCVCVGWRANALLSCAECNAQQSVDEKQRERECANVLFETESIVQSGVEVSSFASKHGPNLWHSSGVREL